MKRYLTVGILPALILLTGAALAVGAVLTKPTATRARPPAAAPVVEVMEAQPGAAQAKVVATGLVQAARRVTLTAEVGGRIISHSPQLIPGGRVQKGELLAQIDPRDYRLMVAQEQGRVRQAEVELELERGRQRVALREWELLRKDQSPEQAPLALRKPQLRAAEQALEAAKSGLERAKLSLERTALRAPFNAVVVEESVEVGRVLGPGTQVATLIGTDELWVATAVQVEDLAFLDVPGLGAEQGSSAVISQRLGGGRELERKGRILRLMGELDPASRRASLLVAVEDPFGSAGGGLPLLPGAHVTVTLLGRSQDGVVPVPRAAVVDGTRVWTLDPQDKLRRRQVEIGWTSADRVYVVGGLGPGERVVTSPLALPIEGAPVRVDGEADAGRRAGRNEAPPPPL
jgi:RND family efflux transporter MFP subunit